MGLLPAARLFIQVMMQVYPDLIVNGEVDRCICCQMPFSGLSREKDDK